MIDLSFDRYFARAALRAAPIAPWQREYLFLALHGVM